MDLTQVVIPPNIQVREDKAFCTDCGQWEYITGKIKHAKTCKFDKTQITQKADFDKIFDGYQNGYVCFVDEVNDD